MNIRSALNKAGRYSNGESLSDILILTERNEGNLATFPGPDGSFSISYSFMQRLKGLSLAFEMDLK
jgi:hypothetical protein